MIEIENVSIPQEGFEAAIRGMRNPMDSWVKSDSTFVVGGERHDILGNFGPDHVHDDGVYIGPNDLDLMRRLNKGGTDESKYRRMIVVYADITAPLYWWKEFDTYKVGTVANSCSTMHKIHAKEFTIENFSTEHLYQSEEIETLLNVIDMLNSDRELYLDGKRKDDWWQMIQLLPSSYNQKRTVMLNYEVLSGTMYRKRKNHKLDEWREFCKWVETLPYAKEIIIGEENASNG